MTDHHATGTEARDRALEELEARRRIYVTRGRRALLEALLSGCDGMTTADHYASAVDLPADIDPRCLGAVPRALVASGIIRSAGYVRSARPSRNASPIAVWQLVDRDAALRWLAEHPDMPDPATAQAEQLALPGMD